MFGDHHKFNFVAFGCCLHIYKLFMRNAKATPGLMSEAEFLNSLKEKTFNANILAYFDNFYNPT